MRNVMLNRHRSFEGAFARHAKDTRQIEIILSPVECAYSQWRAKNKVCDLARESDGQLRNSTQSAVSNLTALAVRQQASTEPREQKTDNAVVRGFWKTE